MTRKNNNFTSKTKSILILAVTFLLSFILLLCTACGTDSSSSSDKEYSKYENDTSIINNGSFEYGTYALKNSDYPKNSSITGWSSVSSDNSADASDVSSGIVYTETEAWKAYLDKLCKDNDFIKYAKYKYVNDGTLQDDATDDDVKTAIKNETSGFISPQTHDGKSGKVLMINNYTENYEGNMATAQKSTSSSTITLKKGEEGVITFWVKTRDLKYNANQKGGAYLKLINTINGNSQSDYSIYGIDTEALSDDLTTTNGWKQYKIYIKGDANFETTYKVVVGLGFGNGSKNQIDWTQGTVFFDDIKFAKETYSATNETKLVYGEEEEKFVKVDNNSEFAYDMTLNQVKKNDSVIDLTSTPYFKTDFLSSATVGGDYTTSQNGQFVGSFNGSSKSLDLSSGNSIVLDIVKASYIITIENNSLFNVATEEYLLLSFKITTDFAKTDTNNVSFYIVKQDDSEESVKSISYSDDEQEVTLMFKNNNKDNDSQIKTLKVIVGPTDVSDRKVANYSTGKLTISDIKYTTGSVNQYTNDVDKIETDNYKLYSLYSGLSTIITLDSDTTESASTSYSFSPAPSSYGQITTGFANVSGYKGVTPTSAYLIENGSAGYVTNTNANAGLINTKYLYDENNSNYATAVKTLIGSALGSYNTTDKYIQPVVIGKTSDSTAYGFIGNSTITVSANQFAKISIKVKVVDETTEKPDDKTTQANVYLVDTEGKTKNVLALPDFTENTNRDDYITVGGNSFDNNSMVLTATESSMEDDGWATLTFYVATGNTEKKFRVEMWNGTRDGSVASNDVVFFDNIQITSSNGFSEPTDNVDQVLIEDTIFAQINNDNGKLGMYRRVLGEDEIEYNESNPDSAVSYEAKYIWGKSSKIAYACFNTLDPTPFVVPTDDAEEDTGAGCTAQTDPASFWLSFSSIIIGAALLFAIVMLFVRTIRRKRKANASDAKSHYKVTSRVANKKQNKKTKNTKREVVETESINNEEIVETAETDNQTAEDGKAEETLDEYVYGDVQDFGETETNENDNKSE